MEIASARRQLGFSGLCLRAVSTLESSSFRGEVRLEGANAPQACLRALFPVHLRPHRFKRGWVAGRKR